MGNCLNSSSSVQNSLSYDKASGDSKFRSKSEQSSILFSTTPSSSNDSFNLEIPYTPRREREILCSSYVKAFTYSELRSATQNFRPDNLAGEGEFGYVYKGWVDEYSLTPSKPGLGITVAIKKLKPECFHKEWLAEIEYLGQHSHPNLVKLIGYCLDGGNNLLVYEYMPKGSLDNLFRRSSQPLSWGIRMKVAVGAAKAITILHDDESQVICRNVKSSNILLDLDSNARLSDFGLAKAGPTVDNIHLFTQVSGNFGYVDPEYIAAGRLSARAADVYSFGVVLLEILSGRLAYDKNRIEREQYLVDWARPFLRDKRKLHKIMDPRLGSQYSKESAHIVAKLALDCINNEARFRPKMSEVLAALEPLQIQEKC